jgi:hypothetical protein
MDAIGSCWVRFAKLIVLQAHYFRFAGRPGDGGDPGTQSVPETEPTTRPQPANRRIQSPVAVRGVLALVPGGPEFKLVRLSKTDCGLATTPLRNSMPPRKLWGAPNDFEQRSVAGTPACAPRFILGRRCKRNSVSIWF